MTIKSTSEDQISICTKITKNDNTDLLSKQTQKMRQRWNSQNGNDETLKTEKINQCKYVSFKKLEKITSPQIISENKHQQRTFIRQKYQNNTIALKKLKTSKKVR